MPHTTARKVVVVDDDMSIVTLLAAHLSVGGYYVITCLDPLDAIMRCETDKVSAMISDWHMPGFSGLEVLEVLQQKNPQVLRVLLTAAPSEPEVREAVRTGLVELLVEKPWGRAGLLSSLAAALASPR